jgi:L-aminopeptidase/D-esterase-like protein
VSDGPRPVPGATDSIVDVPGLCVGQVTLGAEADGREGVTGLSVVIAPHGAVGSVDVRGAAPGSRETDALSPTTSGEQVHAVALVGRSVFGLAAADGVTIELERRGIGLSIARPDATALTIPIVAAAVIFDLGSGDPAVRPGRADGEAAAARALEGEQARPASGSVGAGTGAWTGGIVGPRRKGGTGHASLVVPLPAGTLAVGALVVVNAAGRVEPDGRFDPVGELPDLGPIVSARGQTTLAVIGTNARLSKAQVARVAAMAHDGLARVIRPIHSGVDGDAVFALAVTDGPGARPIDVHPWGAATTTIVGSIAADACARAVGDAMRAAAGVADRA